MKKVVTFLLCLCMMFAMTACGATEADYKLGLGVVVDLNSSATNNAQIDATVAAVVLDADGKIVACRIDAVQNKISVTDGIVEANGPFKTKMEQGDDYGMAAALGYGMDWNGDGVVKEWYDQAKAFEAYVVGKTVAEVEAIETKVVEGSGYVIAKDDALLSAGCTIQITDFIAAVAKACKDDQGMEFKTADSFTLGVAAKSASDAATKNATAETDGSVNVYSDMACSVVANGKVIATLNDAIQPKITINLAGEIVTKNFVGTKRELKEDYNMAAWGQPNVEGNVVKEWYVQSKAFSNYVVGKTASEIASMETQEVNSHFISTEQALLDAGCTMQITGICAVVSQSATNAR